MGWCLIWWRLGEQFDDDENDENHDQKNHDAAAESAFLALWVAVAVDGGIVIAGGRNFDAVGADRAGYAPPGGPFGRADGRLTLWTFPTNHMSSQCFSPGSAGGFRRLAPP